MKSITKREWSQILRQSLVLILRQSSVQDFTEASVQVKWQLAGRIWLFVLLGIVSTSSTGRPLESSLGWVAYRPTLIRLETKQEKRKRRRQQANECCHRHHVQLRAGWTYGRRSWERPLLRSLLLLGLWQLSGWKSGGWLVWLPWLEWGTAILSYSWPCLGQQIEMRTIRWGLNWLGLGSTWLLGGLVVWRYRPEMVFGENNLWQSAMSLPVMGCVKSQKAERPIQKEKAQVSVVREGGQYRIKLEGPLHMTLPAGRSFWLRITILFLRQLESPTLRCGSGATRDGRRPFVSQQQLAAWFDVKQPEISRWEKYLLDENWADLLSLNTPLVLTWELR